MDAPQNQSLKIAHVSAVFPPYWSGTGNVAYYNALELARRGHAVHVFTAEYPSNDHYKDPPEVQVHRLITPFRIGNAPMTPSLINYLFNFDLVHLHWPYIFGSELVWLALHAKSVPLVITYHMDLRKERKWIFGPYQTIWGPKLISSAKRIIAVSFEHIKSTQIYPTIVELKSFVLEVPNGVDPHQFHPGIDGKIIRDLYGIPADDLVIMFVGALDRAHEYKGIPDLLQAFRNLNMPDVWLLIAGDGDLRSKYVQMTADLCGQHRERVIFAGAVSHDNLPAFYTASDVCVLPSREPESFGMVLIEAMSCGVPVIASDSPGVRLVVPEEAESYLTVPGSVDDIASKINRLLTLHAVERKELGQVGRKKVLENYTWKIAAEKLEAIYLDVIKES